MQTLKQISNKSCPTLKPTQNLMSKNWLLIETASSSNRMNALHSLNRRQLANLLYEIQTQSGQYPTTKDGWMEWLAQNPSNTKKIGHIDSLIGVAN